MKEQSIKMSSPASDLKKDMMDFIREFCDKIGPRPPCSNRETKSAELFYDKLKSYCDEVFIEEFKACPGAYRSGFRLPMVLHFFSILFYWFYPWLSLILTIISLIILFGKMTLAREVIDFLFPNKKSQNVIGKIKPKNQRRELIIIGSHLDSNWEFSLIKILKSKFKEIISLNVFLNVILFSVLLVKTFMFFFNFSLQGLFFNNELIIFTIFLVTIPLPLIQLFLMISNRPVMGANDNLSGLAVCYELAKNLSLSQNKPQNVEIWINAYGCEEIGSKGSKEFIKKHLEEIKDAKIINIDMVGCKNVPLLVGKSEIHGIIKMSDEMIELIRNSANKLHIKTKINSFMFFTDSLSFRRKNLSATSICSSPASSKEYYYHTREDTLENMDFENLVNTYKICIDVIKELNN